MPIDTPWHRGAGAEYTQARLLAQTHWLEYRAFYLCGYAFNMVHVLTKLVDASLHLGSSLILAARAEPSNIQTRASVHETRLLHNDLFEVMRASLMPSSPCWGNRRALDRIEQSATMISVALAAATSAAEDLIRECRPLYSELTCEK